MHSCRLVVRVAAASLSVAAAAAQVPEDVVEKILQAAPAEAYAAPRQPRKLLVFTKTAGFRHDSIPVGVAAMRVLGEKTGAFAVTHTEDARLFADADRLGTFDAICMLNTTGDVFTHDGRVDEAAQRNLLAFVRGGKGLVGIHAATDTCYGWPEYGLLIGGYFDGHPWHEQVTIRNEQPRHPLNAALEGKELVITDEIYQHRDPYSRGRLHVLLSLDTSRTDMSKQGINRTDGDFAVSWVRREGGGRVFYCSLGHRDEIYWNPAVLRHFLAGIQFALGDLPAPTGMDD